jgi:hypothetical protein
MLCCTEPGLNETLYILYINCWTVNTCNVNAWCKYWYINIDWEWQITEPTSRQRGHPTGTRLQLSENNLRTESNIWSQVPEWTLTYWLTDWPTVCCKLTSKCTVVKRDEPRPILWRFLNVRLGRRSGFYLKTLYNLSCSHFWNSPTKQVGTHLFPPRSSQELRFRLSRQIQVVSKRAL